MASVLGTSSVALFAPRPSSSRSSKCPIHCLSPTPGSLSPDEWEVAYLYLSFVLRKRGQPEQPRVNGKRDKGKMHLSKDDIMYIGSGI
ncbi:unnamed protein product [Camellia sinensis]